MKTEIIKVDPKEFGLKENEVQTIEQAFMPKIAEREGLRNVYAEIINKEINPELCKQAKECRLKLVKVRTGIAEIHKTQKAFFLAAGRFVDAWKNKETEPVVQMEENLQAIEEHYERIEAEKRAKLHQERVNELSKYQDQNAFVPGNLGELTDEVWQNYLLGVKTAYEQKIKAEQEAREAEEKRIAEEKAEQERIRKENERLKKEAEEREQLAKLEAEKRAKEEAARAEAEKKEREAYEAELRKEREEREKVERELKAKAEAEAKARAEAEEAKEAELNKGDAEKVKDLIVDLESLKTKYSFKSKKNIKMYSDICILLDKVIAHAEKF